MNNEELLPEEDQEMTDEAKEKVVSDFLKGIFEGIPMDIPDNINQLVTYIIEHLDHVSDSNYISEGDVIDGLRDWIENQRNDIYE